MAVSVPHALLCSCAKFQAYSIGLTPSVSVTGSSVLGGAASNSGMHLGLGMAAGAAACFTAGVQQVLLPQTVFHAAHGCSLLLHASCSVAINSLFFKNCCRASRHWLVKLLLHPPKLQGPVIKS